MKFWPAEIVWLCGRITCSRMRFASSCASFTWRSYSSAVASRCWNTNPRVTAPAAHTNRTTKIKRRFTVPPTAISAGPRTLRRSTIHRVPRTWQGNALPSFVSTCASRQTRSADGALNPPTAAETECAEKQKRCGNFPQRQLAYAKSSRTVLFSGVDRHRWRRGRKIILFPQLAVHDAGNLRGRRPLHAARIPAQQHRQRDLRMCFIRVREEPADFRRRGVIVARSRFADGHLVAAAVKARPARAIQHRRQHAFADFRKNRSDVQFPLHLGREILNVFPAVRIL